MNADVHALTGAYALGALSEFETVAVERHIAECGQCADEVRELLETTSRLGMAAAVEPPPGLKLRVLTEIGEVRQQPPSRPKVVRGPSPWALRLSTAAAVVGIGGAAVFGTLWLRAPTEDPASALLRAGDASVIQGHGKAGTGSVLVSKDRNQVMVLASDMAAPPTGHVYQAWFMSPNGARSAGLLPDGTATKVVLASGIGDATQVGISVEPTGGSEQPTTDAVMVFDLPT